MALVSEPAVQQSVLETAATQDNNNTAVSDSQLSVTPSNGTEGRRRGSADGFRALADKLKKARGVPSPAPAQPLPEAQVTPAEQSETGAIASALDHPAELLQLTHAEVEIPSPDSLQETAEQQIIPAQIEVPETNYLVNADEAPLADTMVPQDEAPYENYLAQAEQPVPDYVVPSLEQTQTEQPAGSNSENDLIPQPETEAPAKAAVDLNYTVSSPAGDPGTMDQILSSDLPNIPEPQPEQWIDGPASPDTDMVATDMVAESPVGGVEQPARQVYQGPASFDPAAMAGDQDTVQDTVQETLQHTAPETVLPPVVDQYATVIVDEGTQPAVLSEVGPQVLVQDSELQVAPELDAPNTEATELPGELEDLVASIGPIAGGLDTIPEVDTSLPPIAIEQPEAVVQPEISTDAEPNGLVSGEIPVDDVSDTPCAPQVIGETKDEADPVLEEVTPDIAEQGLFDSALDEFKETNLSVEQLLAEVTGEPIPSPVQAPAEAEAEEQDDEGPQSEPLGLAEVEQELDLEVTETPGPNTEDQSEVVAADQTDIETDAQPEVAVVDQPAIETVEQRELVVADQADIESAAQPEITAADQSDIETEDQPEVAAADLTNIEVEDQPEVTTADQIDAETEDQPEVAAADQADIEVEDQPEATAADQTDTETEDQPEVAAADQTDIEVEDQPEATAVDQTDTETEDQPEVAAADQVNVETDGQSEVAVVNQADNETDEQLEAAATDQADDELEDQSEVFVVVQDNIETEDQVEAKDAAAAKIAEDESDESPFVIDSKEAQDKAAQNEVGKETTGSETDKPASESETKTDQASNWPTEKAKVQSDEFAAHKIDPQAGETARMLLDIMSKPSGAAQPQERALAADTLLRLVPKIPVTNLITLAERICMMEQPPALLVNKMLKHPRPEVAGPLLEGCVGISDQVLMEVISAGDIDKQKMIARRRALTPTMCDELLEHGDASVYLTIVRNPGASISHEAFRRLSDFAKNQAALQAPLVTRGDTPAPIAFELFWFLPSELRRYVLSRFLTDSETLDKILKITLAVDGLEDTDNDQAESRFADPAKMQKLVDLIENGEIEAGTKMLAELAGINATNASRILNDSEGEPITVAMKAIGFARTEYSKVVEKWRNANSILPESQRPTTELQNLFDSLSFNKARMLLTYWDWAADSSGPYALKAA